MPRHATGTSRCYRVRGTRPRLPHIRNLQAAAATHVIAEKTDATPAQVALSWLMEKGEDIVPIPGTKRRAHLEENLGAIDVVLSPEEMEYLDRRWRQRRLRGRGTRSS